MDKNDHVNPRLVLGESCVAGDGEQATTCVVDQEAENYMFLDKTSGFMAKVVNINIFSSKHLVFLCQQCKAEVFPSALHFR